MRKFILPGLLLFCFTTYAQRTKKAVVIADSILRSQIGDRLFQYFSVSGGSYYSYAGRKGKQRTWRFLQKKRLPKSFVTLNFLYHFDYPKIEGVRGGLWLIVDKDFQLIDSLNFEFIPKFIVENKPSEFISVDSASAIVQSNSKPNSYKVSIPILSYDEKSKQYIYTASHTLTVVLNATGKDMGDFEVIEINATTGNIINISKVNKGTVIR
ncbi:hypothetical protein [Ferruginibacter sp.]